MKLLGISGSGRSGGITAEVVQEILRAAGLEQQYISLSGKKINGCIGCLQCAADNVCRQEDDWNAIGAAMLDADAIVFGAPDYYGGINALAHACLERTFCFRHRENFLLAGTLGVAVGVDGGDEQSKRSAVIEYIERIMRSNMMAVVSSVYADGYSQCYTCGFGEGCYAGSVVAKHGCIDQILPEHCPPRLKEQEKSLFVATRTGKLLGTVLADR